MQILANTATWEPDFGPIDVALIDGCHDAEFVYGDTRKVLARCREGSLILWHDFHPALRRVYPWIASVCDGRRAPLPDGLLRGPHPAPPGFVGRPVPRSRTEARRP